MYHKKTIILDDEYHKYIKNMPGNYEKNVFKIIDYIPYNSDIYYILYIMFNIDQYCMDAEIIDEDNIRYKFEYGFINELCNAIEYFDPEKKYPYTRLNYIIDTLKDAIWVDSYANTYTYFENMKNTKVPDNVEAAWNEFIEFHLPKVKSARKI